VAPVCGSAACYGLAGVLGVLCSKPVQHKRH
jgi:hypothetical protein